MLTLLWFVSVCWLFCCVILIIYILCLLFVLNCILLLRMKVLPCFGGGVGWGGVGVGVVQGVEGGTRADNPQRPRSLRRARPPLVL